MKGKIINFKAEKGFGFIKGEDKKSYFFHISNVSNPMDIEENYPVDFKGQEKDKGLVATNIKVNTPLASGSKDKILKIKDLRIRASDIKEYEISNFLYPLSDDSHWYNEVRKPCIDERMVYYLKITRYSNKNVISIEFRTCDGDKNKEDAYKWLDYIDDELEKLI